MSDEDITPPAWMWLLAVVAAAAGVAKFVITQMGWFPNG